VEHSCYQCGAAVEDGTAFCPHCSAPQIRVAGAEAAVQQGVAAIPETGFTQPRPQGEASQLTGIGWRRALPSCALAGLIAAIFMVMPLGASFGLGMLASGFLSVLFYRRRVPGADPRPGMGARLGAASGVLGFAIFGVLSVLEMAFFRSGGELRGALVQAVEQAAARNVDPQAQQMLQYLKTPQGLVVVMILGLIVMFFAFLIFSTLGGVLGAAMLRRRERP